MLCRLNDSGIQAMHDWLDGPACEGHDVPEELLTIGRYVEPTGIETVAPDRKFENRFAWAQIATEMLRDVPVAEAAADEGLWCWLTLFYFDQVCPKSGSARKIGQRARYVPTGSDFRTNYRHLLAGPWRVMAAHNDDPRRTVPILAGTLTTPGELYEQIVSRMELATSPTVLEVVTALYWDPVSGARKRGAGGAGRGSPRRLADILMQFDVTYDIYEMSPSGLLSLLPKEFSRFKPST